MQHGGVTEASVIPISGYTRRLRENQFTDFTRGAIGRIKKGKGSRMSSGKVRPYDLHLPGGATIPARPFFPRNLSELSAWGYQAKIKRIFAEYFKTDL